MSVVRALGLWLRRLYHQWWVADDEESRSYDEREQAWRMRNGRMPK